MENFYGVNETEEEARIEDAASFTVFIKQNKEERAKELQSKNLSVTKGSVEQEEVGEERDVEEIESVASTSSQASKPRTLLQIKHKEKYPTKCKLSEAQLFYPTSAESLHETGVDGKFIGTTENLIGYRGLYCCLYGDCDYGAQVRGNMLSHIHRVHLGAAFGCRFCPELAWWQARSWSNHMDSVHASEPKCEALQLPSSPREAVKIEPNLFTAKEHFTIPVPKSTDTEDEPSSKRIKQEVSGLMTYQEFEKASKEGDIVLRAQGKNPLQPHPKVAMIRYHTGPTGGQVAEFAANILSSSSKEKPSEANIDILTDDPTDDPDYVPDSQEDEDDEFDKDEEALLCDEDEVI